MALLLYTAIIIKLTKSLFLSMPQWSAETPPEMKKPSNQIQQSKAYMHPQPPGMLPASESEGTVGPIKMSWSAEAKARLDTIGESEKAQAEELAYLVASRLGDVKTKILYAQLETS